MRARWDSTVSASACAVSRDSRATLGVERLPGVLEFGHPGDRVLLARARLAGLVTPALQGRGDLLELGVDAFDARARRVEPALLALQLAGQFRHAAMAVVGRALRVLALLFRQQQAVAPGADPAIEFLLALLQVFDLRAQRLDLPFAQQRTLLRRAGPDDACPSRAKLLARTGDDRFALRQPGQQGARRRHVLGEMQPRQQPQDRARPPDLRGERRRRDCIPIAARRIHQRDAAFVETCQRLDQ